MTESFEKKEKSHRTDYKMTDRARDERLQERQDKLNQTVIVEGSGLHAIHEEGSSARLQENRPERLDLMKAQSMR